MAPLQLSEAESSRHARPGLAPVQALNHQGATTSIEEQVESFLQVVETKHPELLYQALRNQSFDFVTALLDRLEPALAGQYLPLNFPLLRMLVAEFGWGMIPLYPSAHADSQGQAFKVQRPSRERETHCRDQTTRTQHLARPTPTKNMEATLKEAWEYLSDYFMGDADIIHALQTRPDDFAEALFDFLEEELRLLWVSPQRLLIKYLLETVGWEIGATTGGDVPRMIMVRPAHHTVELSPGGMWVRASWISRSNARRAWERGEIGDGESYQSWYQAQFRATEARAKDDEHQKAWVAEVRSRQSLKRSRKPRATAMALNYDDSGPNYDVVLQKLSESKAKLVGRLEHVREMQTQLWQESSKIRKQLSHVDEHIVEVEKVKLKSRIPRPVDNRGRRRLSI
ncbi:hypothetical protein N0V93_004772 [Gnomoniopsis smithogilvyi]|uniref:Uncharacterized protein n=1 Tax=Gnomoniopsis smithogilvyi TaxID=1191159 RepID=A0A9W8YT75_9PEZI|nr:hypothetical protein N0V93_004772 [Gnomoniopsis smithogilvyi]